MADREDIQALDEQIVRLINRRYELARDTGTVTPAPAPASAGPATPETLTAIYREIVSGEQSVVRPLCVAFLGPEATFSHLAAIRRFGESVDSIPRQTIGDVFIEVEKGSADFGVVPVENSTEGAVTLTFDRFADSNVQICGEIYVQIHHHLLSRGALEELRVLYSHPQVFGQCRRWLQQHLAHCELVEMSSTSAAAARAAREDGAGALGCILAAEKCGLNVLAEKVEDASDNITRFLVISAAESDPTGDDKTSVMFAIQDRVGALYDALLPFKNNGVNLTMIQSRPSKQKTWEYHFFVDFLGHARDPNNAAALGALADQAKYVKLLGSYPRSPEAL